MSGALRFKHNQCQYQPTTREARGKPGKRGKHREQLVEPECLGDNVKSKRRNEETD